MREGAIEWFGAGIAGLGREGAEVRVSVLRPAHGALLRVSDEGEVTLLWTGPLGAGRERIRVPAPARVTTSETTRLGQGPSGAEQAAYAVRREAERAACQAQRSRPRTSTTGATEIVPSQVVTCVVRTPAPAPAEIVTLSRTTWVRDHVLLVVADVPLTGKDVAERLAPVREIEFASLAHDLPEYLVGDRTPMWAGYLVRR